MSPPVVATDNSGLSALQRAKKKVSDESEIVKMAAKQDPKSQELSVIMLNINNLRESIKDLCIEFDASYKEIEKLKRSDLDMNESMEELHKSVMKKQADGISEVDQKPSKNFDSPAMPPP